MADEPAMQVTLGNVISWIVMVATMGVVYGTLTRTVEQATVINEKQDAALASLRDVVSDIRVEMANGNGDLKLIRELLQRQETRDFNQTYRPSRQ